MESLEKFTWYDVIVRFQDLATRDMDMFYIGHVRAESKEHARELLFMNVMHEHAPVNFASPIGPDGPRDPRRQILIYWIGITNITDTDLIAHYDAMHGVSSGDPPSDPPPPSPPKAPKKKPVGRAGVIHIHPRDTKPKS